MNALGEHRGRPREEGRDELADGNGRIGGDGAVNGNLRRSGHGNGPAAFAVEAAILAKPAGRPEYAQPVILRTGRVAAGFES